MLVRLTGETPVLRLNMADDDYILDISGLGGKKPQGENPQAQRDSAGKPFISVLFDCCNVYQRIYRNATGDAYVGWCPKCMRKITAKIGPDGVDARFFRAR